MRKSITVLFSDKEFEPICSPKSLTSTATFVNLNRLKTQQGLLVDFCAFPQKFVDLLELCRDEEQRDHPK